MNKTCKYCQKHFKTIRHHHVIYCSHSCANKDTAEARKRRVIIICEKCKKKFQVTPGDLRYRKVIRFCSIKCRNVGLKDKNKWTIIECSYCGKSTDTLKSRLKNYKNKFCSKKCSKEYFKENHPAKQKAWGELISNKMNTPEIKSKLKLLNSRNRRPLSQDHKQKISDYNAGKMPKNMLRNGKYGNIKSGKYDINGVMVYFRSRWEANYALYLDFLIKQNEIKRWEYEPDVFIFDKITVGNRSYRPDFKIFNNNGTICYHEIKGYMDKDSKVKLKRMKKYYPEIPLRLVDSKAYNSLKKWSKLLKFY